MKSFHLLPLINRLKTLPYWDKSIIHIFWESKQYAVVANEAKLQYKSLKKLHESGEKLDKSEKLELLIFDDWYNTK